MITSNPDDVRQWFNSATLHAVQSRRFTTMADARRNNLDHVLVVAALLCFALAARTMSPSDIFDNDQAGPISHIADVAFNGNWLMQRTPDGRLATKPPMFPWVGALAVRAIGTTQEWSYKVTVVIAFAAVTVMVFDLTRRAANTAVATLAAAVWIANYHAFKLVYTARTDMLLTMWITLALWSVQRQRQMWRSDAATTSSSWHRTVLIASFSVAVGAGLLTKGPPAMIPVAWLFGAVTYDRAWRRCLPVQQVLGVLLAAALLLAWLVPALRAHPQWADTINAEVIERITGTGSGAKRQSSLLVMPAYFLARFQPWCVLFIAAAALWWSKRRQSNGHLPWWPLLWVAMILLIFTFPRGKRADYILPAYPAAALLVAMLIDRAQAHRGWHRFVVHVVLGGSAIAGIGYALACPWLPRIPDVPLQPVAAVESVVWNPAMVKFGCGAAALIAGPVALWLVHRRRYVAGAMACCFVLVAMLGIYQSTFSRAAKTRRGDAIIALAQTAAAVGRREGVKVMCDGSASKWFAALLGFHRLAADVELTSVDGGAVLLICEEQWQKHKGRFEGQVSVLLRSDTREKVETTYLLVMVGRAGNMAGETRFSLE